MERAKRIVVLVSVLLCVLIAQAQVTTNKQKIYAAYIRGDMQSWKQVIDVMQQTEGKSHEFIMELINYQYGYIGWCIGQKQYSEAAKYKALAERHIRYLEQRNFRLGQLYAYKAAMYGYDIGLNKLKAPYSGPKSIEFAKLSIQTDETTPYGYLQYAHAQYYMPSMFGGSKTLALEYYQKSLIRMEANMSLFGKNWNYLDLLTTLVRVYDELGNVQKAKELCEKILRIEPSFIWVKEELYPNILKKLK